MYTLKNHTAVYVLLAILILCLSNACQKDDENKVKSDDNDDDDSTDVVTYETYTISSSGNAQDSTQDALIRMEDRDTIEFETGKFNYTNTLTVEGKTGIVIKGQGQNETTLSFTNQQAGAEGLKISNCDSVIVKGLTVQNTKGDALKAKDCNVIAFYNVGTVWTGVPSSNNSAYGLYPVKCKDVMIDNCYARGASDAGIYVGQSTRAIIKNSTATKNVAGFEIENTVEADVFENRAFNNTGGILVFDLPDLTQYGRQCRIFDNLVENNNEPNFASGGVVENVPAGTGIMVLSTEKVEIFNNEIINNNIVGTAVVNYNAVIDSAKDQAFDPYPRNIEIHDNLYSRTSNLPQDNNLFGNAIANQFPNDSIPDIQLGGNFAPDEGPSGSICIKNNQGARFVNLNIDVPSFNPDFDVSAHRCDHTALQEVNVATP